MIWTGPSRLAPNKATNRAILIDRTILSPTLGETPLVREIASPSPSPCVIRQFELLKKIFRPLTGVSLCNSTIRFELAVYFEGCNYFRIRIRQLMLVCDLFKDRNDPHGKQDYNIQMKTNVRRISDANAQTLSSTITKESSSSLIKGNLEVSQYSICSFCNSLFWHFYSSFFNHPFILFNLSLLYNL